MSYFRNRRFTTAAGFLDFLLNDDLFATHHVFDATWRGRGGNIFRGQANSDWPLVPRAHRTLTALDAHTPQVVGTEPPTAKAKALYLGMQLHAELRAVHLFLEASDKLGLATPLDYRLNLEHSELVAAAFNAGLHGKDFVTDDEFPALSLLPEIAFAQHYGVPTRLLDWTESPLVAAYFAAVELSSIAAPDRRASAKSMSVLWLYQLPGKPSDPVRILSSNRAANTHLRSQSGVFTLTPRANSFFLKHLRWPSLEDILLDESTHVRLGKATLPATEADQLLRLMFKYDVTRHHLFPTLENAAKAFEYAKALWPPDSE
ncbi:MAG: FRG domain-containing protein [Gemmatimonadales bacterium]|nr:FRG domain-containing protein [Gemmatimonadales bacterium]